MMLKNLLKLVCPAIAAFLTVSVAQAQTKYWIGDGSANAWDVETSLNWSTASPGSAPHPSTYWTSPTGQTTFSNGDTVRFLRDTPADYATVTVQTAGVTPGSLQIDTGTHWTFQPETAGGGQINAFLNHAYTSGGATSLTFKDYDSSPGFTGAAIRFATCSWQLSSAATEGTYTFLTGAGNNIELTGTAGTPGFMFNVSDAAAGAYTITDDFVVNRNGNLQARVAAGGIHTVIFSGDIALNQNLSLVGWPNPDHNSHFTGTITVDGNRTIGNDLPSTGANQITTGRGDFSGASFAGGAGNTLTFTSTRADMRGVIMPEDGGANIDVGGLTFSSASVHIAASDPSQDYFSGVRNAGGKVTFDDDASYSMQVTFDSGTFLANDLVFIDNAANVINLTIGDDATMRFGLNSLTDPDNGLIPLDGSLTLSGVVEIVNLGGMEEGLYTLSTFAPGGFAGDLGLLNSSLVLTGQIKEASLLLTGDSSALLLDVAKIPEPASALLLGLAALLALHRRR